MKTLADRRRRACSKAFKERILDRDRWTCRYCGRPTNGIDHVVPLSAVVDNTEGNLVTACQSCNSTGWSRIFPSFEAKRDYIRCRRRLPPVPAWAAQAPRRPDPYAPGLPAAPSAAKRRAYAFSGDGLGSCPVCGVALAGRADQETCSAKCRAKRYRQAQADARARRDADVRRLLETALRVLDGSPKSTRAVDDGSHRAEAGSLLMRTKATGGSGPGALSTLLSADCTIV